MTNSSKLKTNYDDEIDIINEVHVLEPSECFILSDREGSDNYLKTVAILNTLLCDGYLEKWKNNSSSNLPPDFINEKDSLMLEVMRIDDHSCDGKKNPVLRREKEMHKELEQLGILRMFPNAQKVICNPVTDLPTDEDHNYKNYYKSFQRTIRKHASKIETYRRNYPNKELIFLVMDETSGIYFEIEKEMCGKPHLVFFDKRFVSEFIDKDIDYLIWFMPYNYFETVESHEPLPHLVIYDVKNLKNSVMMQYIDYDENRMKSCEL